MTIVIKKRKNETVISVVGVLDDVTAPAFEKTVSDSAKSSANIVLDLKGVDRISDAGLRTLIETRERINSSGSLWLTGACESVMQSLEVTG